jgi:outer membrane biosynthesis protein TonB
MRRRLAGAPVFKGACVASALTACSMAQAASVQAVFSAENALYGAGYSIGEADGWVDDNLREALRQFQTDRPELAATGELDSDTLNALGISGQSSELMGGNVVASQGAARKELGLVVASLASSAPQPAPEPQPRSKPEPEPEPEIREEPEPEPEIVTAPPAPVEPEPTTKARAQKQPESEPTSEPIHIASITRSDSQPLNQSKPGAKQAEAKDAGSISVAVSELSGASSSPERPASSGSSGNFLTKMFDFLFGWLV